MPKGFRISSIAAESLKFVTICAVTASIQILDYFGCRQRQHKVATFKQTDGEAALSATGKNILQRNNNEQFFKPCIKSTCTLHFLPGAPAGRWRSDKS